MTNVFQFPHGRMLPARATVDALIDQLTAVELELARARLAQIQLETRQAGALWFSYCLKRALLWGCVLWLLTTCAKAEESRNRSFYNERGSFVGSSVKIGKSTSFYDGRGSFAGTSIRHGNQTSTYDGRGSFTGAIIHTGPRR
jgi:hypothetical protein